MTIIIAALFLPKQPHFLQQLPLSKNISQDSLLENYTLPRIKSNSSLTQLLNSEEFLQNLTAGASNVHSPKKVFYKIGSTKSQDSLFDDTEQLLKNVNKSLRQQLLKTSVYKSTGAIPTLKTTNSNIPSDLKSNNLSTGLPSKHSPINPDLLQQRQIQMYSDNVPNQIDNEMDNDLDSIKINNEDAEEQLEVPKFGGFSHNKAKLLLLNSQDLFNKLPWEIIDNEHSLAHLIWSSSVENPPKENLQWIGTMGIPTDSLNDKVLNNITERLKTEFNCCSIVTDDDILQGAYKNFGKKILWPTLHYQLPDSPSSKIFETDSWHQYVALNEKFAERIIKNYKDGDTIWIHDYHLMLLPRLVRLRFPNAKIGFFLHVSFPSSEVFRCLAHRTEILNGLLAANFIGFQTVEYLSHFLQTCNSILKADITVPGKEIQYLGQITTCQAIPMGIDPFKLQLKIINDPKVKKWRDIVKERWGSVKLIVSKDSIDRISGLEKKLIAYEKFLHQNPDWIGKVTLLQIGYNVENAIDLNLKKKIMILIDRINSLPLNIEIQPPIVFIQQDLELEQDLAINCEADLFWVNSLRAGMNLSCQEFITSTMFKHAPLLLSEFTGSASILSEGSIMINPWDIKQVSEKVKYCLDEITQQQKYYNWKTLVKKIINNDSDYWLHSNIAQINQSWKNLKERTTVSKLTFGILSNDYLETKKHFFLFKLNQPPSDRTLSILNDLSSDAKHNNIVYVINSFSKVNLETLFNRAPNVGLIAENGAFVRLNNNWYNMTDTSVNNAINWQNEVIKLLDDKMERLPGTYYKISDSMIRFHTENADDKDRVDSALSDIMGHINSMFKRYQIISFVRNGVVYIQQSGLSLVALKFLLKFYNSSDTLEIDGLHGRKKSIDLAMISPQIDFICITGSSSPIVDPLFQYINQEMDDTTDASNSEKSSQTAIVQHRHTVVYGTPLATHAQEHIYGRNELMNMLEGLTQL